VKKKGRSDRNGQACLLWGCAAALRSTVDAESLWSFSLNLMGKRPETFRIPLYNGGEEVSGTAQKVTFYHTTQQPTVAID